MLILGDDEVRAAAMAKIQLLKDLSGGAEQNGSATYGACGGGRGPGR
jgi:hypothetical protein